MYKKSCRPCGGYVSSEHGDHRYRTIFLTFLALGFTSFGGPLAHLAYFRETFVVRKQWLSDQLYADIVALCQFLPGAASSQVGMAIGFYRAGYTGALLAWLGFTLPSAIALILLATEMHSHPLFVNHEMLHGLELVATAVVVQAVWGMGQSFCREKPQITIMVLACCMMLITPFAWAPFLVMTASGFIAPLIITLPPSADSLKMTSVPDDPMAGWFWGLAFLILMIGLPFLAQLFPSTWLMATDAFYRAGAIVFGGGHVVLPALQAEVVSRNLVSADAFLLGYSLAQAVPGPLFTFAAFLGAMLPEPLSGWSGGILALVAIFLPSFMLLMTAMPFWAILKRHAIAHVILAGINASVVGILLATLYQPLWMSSVKGPADLCLLLLAWLALAVWKIPPWFIVCSGAVSGWLFWS